MNKSSTESKFIYRKKCINEEYVITPITGDTLQKQCIRVLFWN